MAPPPTTGQTTLLLIDDSEIDRKIFRRFLSQDASEAFHILEAEDGEEGFALQANSPVDLILLDYNLPDFDGLEFLEQLQTQSHVPPVLMLTGQGDEQIAANAIKAGAQDYMVKNQLTSKSLILAVRKALQDAHLKSKLAKVQAQQSLVQSIALRIHQITDLEAILRHSVSEIRQLVECDRVIIYRFHPQQKSGSVAVESVAEQYPAIEGESIEDSCFDNGWIDKYLTGQSTAISDINNSHLSDCHIELLSQYQVQANLVVPIITTSTTLPETTTFAISPASQTPSAATSSAETLSAETSPDSDQLSEITQHKTLWGLLIVHQCSGPRQWQDIEAQLLEQLSSQLAIAIQQASLYLQLQLTNKRLEAKVDERTTALKQANNTLQQLNQALTESNKELEQFAYIASHDLREPLRKIKSFAELLSRRYSNQLDSTADRYIDYITGGAVRMQTLINDLLTYSRLGRQTLQRTSTNLNDALQQALNILSEKITAKQAVIEHAPLPTLNADSLQIELLLTNLIDNALKYNENPAPQVSLSASCENDLWTIAVSDNGIGIEPQFYDRIFAVFQRLHTKSQYSGTGIGLAICQKIVERHGGTLHVRSELGRGSTFWFTLPASPSD